MAVVARQTLIASSLPNEWPETPDERSVRLGVDASRGFGLGRAAFLVRIAALSRAMSPAERAGFWLGAAVAVDAESLARSPIASQASRIWVGGRHPLRDLYCVQLREQLNQRVDTLTDDIADNAAASGAIAIANRWRESIKTS